MQFHKLSTSSPIFYPVGVSMNDTIKIVQEMAALIKLIYGTEEVTPKLQFVVRGSSGAVLAGMISSLLINDFDIIICHIRKEGERTHTGEISSVVINNAFTKTILIDDFIGTGKTIRIINHIISRYTKIDMLCVSGKVFRDEHLAANNFKIDHLISGLYFENREDYNSYLMST